MIKKFLLGTASAVALTTTAMAADLPIRAPLVAVPVFTWEGFYVGADAGYGWSDARTRYTGGADVAAVVAGLGLPPSYKVGDGGATGGVHMGYNWQFGSIVVGGEADASALDIGKKSSARMITPGAIPLPVNGATYVPGNQFDSRASLSSTWQSTIRGRIGYVVYDQFMIFATGGLALAEFNTKGVIAQSFPAGGPTFRTWSGGSSTTTEVGYAVGGGVEYAVTNNWLVKVEGLYSNFGKVRDTLVPSVTNAGGAFGAGNIAPVTRSTRLDATVVRAGVSYKF